VRTILVTGGAGFVGSCLAMGVKQRHPSARVLALDNLKRRGSELNLPRLRGAGVEFIHGDIRSMEDLESAGAVDLILESSAEPSVLAGYTSSPEYLVNTNLLGAINCFELARRHGAATIFLSTSRVYPVATINALAVDETDTRFVLRDAQSTPGVSRHGITEQFPLEGTRSLYGATKLCGEYLLHEYLEMYGLKGIINRCGVITGPWQMGKADQGVVVLWVARHIFGGTLDYIGYGGLGKQVRDMVHVDDILRLVLAQMEQLETLSGQTFNVGGGLDVSVSLRELTTLCQNATRTTIPIGAVTENRPADIRLYLTDNTRITQATGWRPQKTSLEIVEEVARWITDHREELRHILN
jgi:CDP-paratose 2-epimerase